METVKTNFNELVGIANKMEKNGGMINADKVRLWLLANGFSGDLRVSYDAVAFLWTGNKDVDTLSKTVLLIEDSLRENITDISEVYSETCNMEGLDDIPDWKMTTCINEGRAYCTEEYTTGNGKQTNVTVVAPSGVAWFDSKALIDIFAYSPQIYNITVNSLVEHAHGFVPHEEIIRAWLDAFGFDKGHNVVVRRFTPTDKLPSDYQSVLDGVYKDIFGTWLCKAADYPSVLKVMLEAPISIMRGYDTEKMKINEIKLTQLSQILPHSLRDAESILVKVWENDSLTSSITLQYILWNGHLFDYEKSRELVNYWTME